MLIESAGVGRYTVATFGKWVVTYMERVVSYLEWGGWLRSDLWLRYISIFCFDVIDNASLRCLK